MAAKKESGTSVGRVLRWCSLLTIVYIAAVFALPYNNITVKSYHFSSFEYSIAVLMVNLPVIAVWFFAFWGYAKLRQYSEAIRKTREGKYFYRLSVGLAWLAWSMPIISITSHILNGTINGGSGTHSVVSIIDDYLNLILTLIAFLIIGSAARGIIGQDNKVDLGRISSRVVIALLTLGGVIYCFLVLRSFNLNSISDTNNHYHMPVWLVVITIIIPYLYAWFVGVMAAYEITIYAKGIKGVLYKQALMNIVYGLLAVVLSFITIQYLNNAWQMPAHVIFTARLVVTTIFRIIGGAGYILMAVGASRLKRIEEV
jgi:hypothetical protein